MMTSWYGNTFWINPDGKVHGANMRPIWGQQDPGGHHVGPVNFAIWETTIWEEHPSIIPYTGPVMRTSHDFFAIILNKLGNKQLSLPVILWDIMLMWHHYRYAPMIYVMFTDRKSWYWKKTILNYTVLSQYCFAKFNESKIGENCPFSNEDTTSCKYEDIINEYKHFQSQADLQSQAG